MIDSTVDLVPPSSARRRYLTLDADGGWILTTPPAPADYRLRHSWPRGEGRRLDLEVTDDGDGWRLIVVGWCFTDVIVGRGGDALRESLRFYLPYVPRREAVCDYAA